MRLARNKRVPGLLILSLFLQQLAGLPDEIAIGPLQLVHFLFVVFNEVCQLVQPLLVFLGRFLLCLLFFHPLDGVTEEFSDIGGGW